MLLVQIGRYAPILLFVILLGMTIYSGIWNKAFNPKYIGFDYVKPVVLLGAIDTLLVILQTYLYFRLTGSGNLETQKYNLLYLISFLAFIATVGLLVVMFFAVNNREKDKEKLSVYEIATLAIVYMTMLYRAILVIGPYISNVLRVFVVFYFVTMLTVFFVLPSTGILRFSMRKFKTLLLIAIPLFIISAVGFITPTARITMTATTVATMALFMNYLYLYATT